MNKALILLAAFTLYCCISAQHVSRSGCRCLRKSIKPVPWTSVAKVEVTPPSGRCRQPERVIILKTGNKICISPQAKWFPNLLNDIEKNGAQKSPPTSSPTTRAPAQKHL